MTNKIYNIIILVMLTILSVSIVNAEQVTTLGKFTVDTEIELIQSCVNCSYITFERVYYPDGSIADIDITAVQTNSVWSASYNKTEQLGRYIVYGIGDPDGQNKVFAYDFYMVDEHKFELGYSFLLLIITIILILIGLFVNQPVISILGALGLLFYSFTLYTISTPIAFIVTLISIIIFIYEGTRGYTN